DPSEGVMKKCTLCVDRIYNENLAEAERVPACVASCPVGARHYGDLGDPASEVSMLVAERQGADLMPELGYRPTNKYLPPRERLDRASRTSLPWMLETVADARGDEGTLHPFLRWVDRMLSN